MSYKTRFTGWIYLLLPDLVTASPSLTADQDVPRAFPWCAGYAMPWHGFWWVFPLIFFVMMIVLFIAMMSRGGRCCKRQDRATNNPEPRDGVDRSMGNSSVSALDILDKRYASGEIDKQEYEEKKAAITSK